MGLMTRHLSDIVLRGSSGAIPFTNFFTEICDAVRNHSRQISQSGSTYIFSADCQGSDDAGYARLLLYRQDGDAKKLIMTVTADAAGFSFQTSFPTNDPAGWRNTRRADKAEIMSNVASMLSLHTASAHRPDAPSPRP